MNLLAATFRKSFAIHADRPALKVKDKQLSYADLLAAAEMCARHLDSVAPAGARVALLAHRTIGAYAAILAAVLSGRAYVPIYPKAPPQRQRAVAAAAGCEVYLYDSKSAGLATDLATEFGGAALAVDPIHDGGRQYASVGGDHAYIMFTSGTTGTPKGVAVRYENVVSYLEAFQHVAKIRPQDRCSQFFDLSFDLSVHDMFVAWANGACLCAPVDEELIDPVGFAHRSGITCWFSVPSVAAMARRMRRLEVAALPELRLSLFCGEPLPISIAKSWSEAAPNAALLNLYGPTEATIAITAYRFDPALASSMPPTVPLGDAYDGSAAVPVRADGQPANIGEDGELWLAGAQLTDGYINNPQEQKAKFIEAHLPGYSFRRWYRSGDLVRRDIDWGLVYQGRLDDQVKISGYRVEILEIEEALRWAAGTSEVAAVPWPLTDGGAATGVVGFVCGATFESREVILRCRTLLPPYMVPQRILAVEDLPLNANGKIDRNRLRRELSESVQISA